MRRALVAALLVLCLPALALAAYTAQTPKPKVSSPFLLAGGPGNQRSPSMAGNVMVYSSCVAGNCDIRGVDLATRQAFALATNDWDERQPATDGVRVVWQDARNTDSKDPDNLLSNFDIYGAILADKKPFAINKAPRQQNHPSVWGNTVVWADFRDAQGEADQQAGNIYMGDIPSGKETVIANARSAQVRPVTNGKIVVWADYRNEPDPEGVNADIYAYDLSTRQESPISTAPNTQTDPAISGNIVVWADFRKGDGTSDIYGYDLAARKEFPITIARGSQIQPTISGNIVVWADFRNEPDQKNGTNSDIYGYDLTTRQEFPIYVGQGAQGSPRVTGSTVAWEDDSKGESDYDIYGATISGIPVTTPEPAPPALPGTGSRTFPETGESVTGIFLDYWTKNGGLAQQGFPISDVMSEVSDLNGKTYTVQYFERAVFEYHPENPQPFNVLLSQLGTFRHKKKYPNGSPVEAVPPLQGGRFFTETGKTVSGRFLDYWSTHGGLAQQGLPLSDPFTETSDSDGKPYLVQYFERAVFEMHPENPIPYDVLLSLLGRFRYDQKRP